VAKPAGWLGRASDVAGGSRRADSTTIGAAASALRLGAVSLGVFAATTGTSAFSVVAGVEVCVVTDPDLSADATVAGLSLGWRTGYATSAAIHTAHAPAPATATGRSHAGARMPRSHSVTEGRSPSPERMRTMTSSSK
jgi:hypothetical protein